MRIVPGTRFRLLLSDDLHARLHREGWAGSGRGVIEQVDDERVTVRFADGQPWHFLRGDFEGAIGADDLA